MRLEKHIAWAGLACLVTLAAGASPARAGSTFTVGGVVFYDNSSGLAALTSGVGDVIVRICPLDGGGCLQGVSTPEGGPDIAGLWSIENVPPGDYELAAFADGWCSRHLAQLVPVGPVPFSISVDQANEADNQNLQLQALCCPDLPACPSGALLCHDLGISCAGPPIPSASAWGLAAFAVLLLGVGAVVVGRRHRRQPVVVSP